MDRGSAPASAKQMDGIANGRGPTSEKLHELLEPLTDLPRLYLGCSRSSCKCRLKPDFAMNVYFHLLTEFNVGCGAAIGGL